MNKIKKHSIGYNTVSSVDGVIFAKGVKSKPNNIQIFGYTHEIGEGEKSPDNPYTLVSLDSGNVNLYSENKLSTFIVDSASKAKRKGLLLPTPKSKFYCVHWDNNAKIPIAYKLINKETAKIGTYQWTKKSTLISVPFGYDLLIYDASGNGTTISAFTEKENLMVLDSSMMPDAYISDEHSITLANNNTTIQVPIPVPLYSVEGVSDYIFKDTDGIWKLMQNCQKYEFSGNEDCKVYENVFYINDAIKDYQNEKRIVCTSNSYTGIKNQISAFEMTSQINNSICFREKPYSNVIYIKSTSFTTKNSFMSWLLEQYKIGTPLIMIYQLKIPIVHTLSDYAQELLNSFVLENKNNISVDGNPTFKITGYLQK